MDPFLLKFPNPLTVGDYKAWYRKLFELDESLNKEDVENGVLLRQYKAAWAITQRVPLPLPDNAQPPEAPPAFTLADLEPDNVELPLTAVSWVTDCADEALGLQLRIEDVASVIKRRQASKHTSPVFAIDDPEIGPLFPDLAQYSGGVTFHTGLTKTVYRAYDKARQIDPAFEVTDIENTHFMRQLRAAIPLVKEWQIEGVPWKLAKNDRGDGLPLVLASFLIEAADIYLSKRINLKKLRGIAGNFS
jgi:hypothetical protein